MQLVHEYLVRITYHNLLYNRNCNNVNNCVTVGPFGSCRTNNRTS